MVVGVSGGADSLCLVHWLQQHEFNLLAAHFDHQLRAESGTEAAYVQQMMAALHIPCVTGSADVRAWAVSRHLSIEEAAREQRYQFLFESARQHQAAAVLTAHHANDQVETVMMHLLRGSGLSGLCGMAYAETNPHWDDNILLVRPLLQTWRAEIDAYCLAHHLKPVQDASNFDQTYHRNRIRHELLPMLKTYNPQIDAALWRMADVLREDDLLLQAVTGEALAACDPIEGDGWVSFLRQPFLQASVGLQRRLLRALVARLRPALRDISWQTLEFGRVFIQQPARAHQRDWVSKLSLALHAGRVFMMEWGATLPLDDSPQVAAGCAMALDAGKPVNLMNGWQLVISDVTDLPQTISYDPQNRSIWLDADKVSLPLIVRTRRAGDRYAPIGLAGRHQKLSDAMINAKIPVQARSAYPVICNGDDIIWLPGLLPAEAVSISAQTRQVMQMKLIRDDEN